jgi:hypothetical protein
LADNISITQGSGTTVATDDISGVHYQVVKLADGTLNSTNAAKVSSAGALSVEQAVATYSVKTGDATASGDTTIHTPTGGTAVRLHYICLSALGTNSADVTVTVKLGSTSLYKLNLRPGAMWARNIGAGHRYLQGATNDVFKVTLSASQTVSVSMEYEEI